MLLNFLEKDEVIGRYVGPSIATHMHSDISSLHKNELPEPLHCGSWSVFPPSCVNLIRRAYLRQFSALDWSLPPWERLFQGYELDCHHQKIKGLYILGGGALRKGLRNVEMSCMFGCRGFCASGIWLPMASPIGGISANGGI